MLEPVSYRSHSGSLKLSYFTHLYAPSLSTLSRNDSLFIFLKLFDMFVSFVAVARLHRGRYGHRASFRRRVVLLPDPSGVSVQNVNNSTHALRPMPQVTVSHVSHQAHGSWKQLEGNAHQGAQLPSAANSTNDGCPKYTNSSPVTAVNHCELRILQVAFRFDRTLSSHLCRWPLCLGNVVAPNEGSQCSETEL